MEPLKFSSKISQYILPKPEIAPQKLNFLFMSIISFKYLSSFFLVALLLISLIDKLELIDSIDY